MQMRCVEILLKAGAAMDLRQMNITLDALPTLEDPKVLLHPQDCRLLQQLCDYRFSWHQ